MNAQQIEDIRSGKAEMPRDMEFAYADYISSETLIGNGTMLINAIEGGKFLDGLLDRMEVTP